MIPEIVEAPEIVVLQDCIYRIQRARNLVEVIDGDQWKQIEDSKEEKYYRAALVEMIAKDPDCQCDHSDDDCCAEQPTGFCARCFAAKALSVRP